MADVRGDLLQDFLILRSLLRCYVPAETCDIAARPGQAGNEPSTDWVERNRHNDRDGLGCFPRNKDWATIREDDINLQGDKFCGKRREPFDLSLGGPDL